MRLVARQAVVFGILLALPAVLAARAAAEGPQCACADRCETEVAEPAPSLPVVRRSGSWIIEETENFYICRPASYQARPGLALSFERLRSELCEAWLSSAEQTPWAPKCHIVVHPGLDGYLREVGPGGRQTIGSSLIDFDKGAVSRRRIDIRGDKPNWFTEALAHELTHVVLADRFIESPIPHWADEGMAIQADTLAKRRLHGQDLSNALAAGSVFRVAELVSLESYPHPSRMGAFYGQSASLVDYLTTIGTKQQMVDFVSCATTEGYDVALRKTYDIAGVGELEQRWRRHVSGGHAAREAISARGTRAEKPQVSRAASPRPQPSDIAGVETTESDSSTAVATVD